MVSYDISDDKIRTKFSKFLEKYGHRIQYSVFEIENSRKLLNNIMCEVDNYYSKLFCEADSVYIFNMSASCEIKRYGYAKHEEEDLIFV
ncbi:MAG: CRISPR-associated endonuclease Cas2 [Lachnospiraceae bacterium]|nr:CRISPR-associated endonuclease Cas2 [Lachnospiraceae bacterium]